MSSRIAREVFICGAARTPIGSFMGSLSSQTATQLGATAIAGALSRAGVDPSEVNHVIMGHVISAGCGQNPARQASLAAGIPNTADVFSVNKVCASGLKSISLAANAIAMGEHDIIVAGGMESMSKIPYINSKVRQGGFKLGHEKFEDILISDGLWDPYNNIHMGSCAEQLCKDFGISRADQDAFAIESYRRAAAAWASGVAAKEVVPVSVPNTNRKSAEKTMSISIDEEFSKLDLNKVAGLKPAFEKDGTITAANASSINDGAAALVLCSAEKARQLGLTPLAKILSSADNAVAPIDFGIAPFGAVERALALAGNPRVDYHEINEAFSSVVLANMQKLNLDYSRVNVNGGAVSIGHPIGASGARIAVTLLNILEAKQGHIGVASICNGGGGATAVVFEKL